MDERLAKLLLVALDARCSDAERLAALNAAARTTEPRAISNMLAASVRQAQAKEHFSFGMEQQLELLQSAILEREQELAAARREIAELKKQRSGVGEDGVELKEVIGMVGLSRATLYRRMAAGTFPRPWPTNGTRKLWSKVDLSYWQRSRNSD